MSPRAVYLIVISLVGLKTQDCEDLLESVQTVVGGDTPVILVGTHLDLCEGQQREDAIKKFKLLAKNMRVRFHNIVNVAAVSSTVCYILLLLHYLFPTLPRPGRCFPSRYISLLHKCIFASPHLHYSCPLNFEVTISILIHIVSCGS